MSKAFIFGVGGNRENESSYGSSLKKILDNTRSTYRIFANCSAVTNFRGIIRYSDTENVTSMGYMFYICTNLAAAPLFDTSKVTDMSSMFHHCSNLTTVPLFDTRNVTSMGYMFAYCRNLTTVPLFDTSKVTNMGYMFQGCSNLTSVPALDMRNVTYNSAMLVNCTNVTEIWIKNINVSLYVSYCTKLTMPSLLNLLNETVYSSTSKTLTLGTTNLAKFTGKYEYVKKTGKLLDLDDNETNVLASGYTKIPVVWCSSTDEGAMKIADYMSSKGWALA